MAHNARTQGGAWVDGQHATPVQMADLARKYARVITDRGGSFAPADQFVIGGLGWAHTGTIIVRGGGTSPAEGFLKTTGASRFQHADGANDFQTLAVGHAGRTLTRITLGGEGWGLPFFATLSRTDFCALQAIAPQLVNFDGTVYRAQMMFPLSVMDAAVLTSVTVTWRGGAPHDAAPAKMPKAALLRLAPDGTATSARRGR